MQIGVTIPNSWGVEDPREVLDLGSLAEKLGFDSVWVMDHLFNVGFVRDRLDDRPYYHPLGILSALSSMTERITLGTSVMVLPYHNPVELAKYVATLDQLSRGRVILGVGAGALAAEFEALGIPMSQRRVLTDESIEIMRELWTNEEASFESDRWSFSGVKFSPKPFQPSGVPIWVGGSSPGARRRAAQLGDGWHPNHGTPEEFAAGCETVREMAAEHGRDPSALTMTLRLDIGLASGPAPSPRDHQAVLTVAEPAQMAESLAAYRDVGVEHIVLAFSSGDVPALREAMQIIASDVAPQIR